MRTNLPVTNLEYSFPEDWTLVSTTDLDSRITYGNATFIEVSGYSREELFGQPHNLIRHPDMPEEAFRDLWQTLRSARPWSGLVKNRRKDGSHYWVVANVTPIIDRGQPVGYMSVRSHASREAIALAEKRYEVLRGQADSGVHRYALRSGAWVDLSLAGRLVTAMQLGLRGRLTLAIALIAASIAAVQWVAAPGWLQGAAWTVMAVMGLWIPFMAERQLLAPLRALEAAANTMAAGNLTPTLDIDSGSREVGRIATALRQLNFNLLAVVADVRREVLGVEATSLDMTSSNADLSSRTVAQASTLEQTAASMEQMTATVQQNAQSASAAKDVAAKATRTAQASQAAVGDVVTSMNAIRDASGRITSIIDVIDGIAFQTNLLALNAAVEAARAGEQGRGFAVVAGEVRILAKRSGDAAAEVRKVIGAARSEIDAGALVVEQAGRSIAEVRDAVGQITQCVIDIAAASAEQSQGIDQLGEAVVQLDTNTQQNAFLVERATDSSRQLHDRAESLLASVKVFRV
ncbi:PAS domain-containing methyl-accepting chemotaxis protein [soil metagenome]